MATVVGGRFSVCAAEHVDYVIDMNRYGVEACDLLLYTEDVKYQLPKE